MARARLNLRSLNRTLDSLKEKVKGLRGKGADTGVEKDMAALHKKLTTIQTMMADECPDQLFRNFEMASTSTTTQGKARGKAKTTRKRTRKAR